MQIFTENVTKFSSKQVISNSILLEKKQRSVWETQRCLVFPPRDTVVPMAQWWSFPGSTPSLWLLRDANAVLENGPTSSIPNAEELCKNRANAKSGKTQRRRPRLRRHFDLLVTLDVSGRRPWDTAAPRCLQRRQVGAGAWQAVIYRIKLAVWGLLTLQLQVGQEVT